MLIMTALSNKRCWKPV